MNPASISPLRIANVASPGATAAIHPLDSRLRSAFEHSMSGVALVDAQGRILQTNAALSDILGRPVAALADQFVGDLVVPDDRAKISQALLELGSRARPAVRLFIRGIRDDGAIISMDANFSAWSERGADVRLLVEMHDVSEWRNSEDELRRIQTQLLQTEKMASIGQLAAGVAHEINNPLGYVYSNLHTLGDYVDDMLRLIGAYEDAERLADTSGTAWDKLRAVKRGIDFANVRGDVVSLVEESREGIQRVKKIVQDLKEFSHAESNDEWAKADLHKGIESTLNIAKNEFKYKAAIERAYGDLPLVECVPSQINQVVMNILINAGQAIKEDGLIRIATGVEGEEVWIDIIDNGSGISKEHLTRIFDPFFTTKQVGVGTGLGLSLSYSIIGKHHGRIEVDSTPGTGTRFRIRLPIRQPKH